MKITREQQDMLETLSCERLSSNEGNFRVIESFFNPRNEKLAQTLLNEAFEEDENDRIAYYLVKDKYGHILFYFSLKCGQLYDKHLDFQLFKELAKLYDDLLKIKKEYQNTNTLESKRSAFYENFNPDADAV